MSLLVHTHSVKVFPPALLIDCERNVEVQNLVVGGGEDAL